MSDLGNKKIMAENIRYYLRKNDINQTEICDALGFKMPTFSDWVNAKTYPRIDKIEMMANYFGITKADLVEKRKTPTDGERDRYAKAVSEIMAGLTEDQKQQVLDYAKLHEAAMQKQKDDQ